MPSEEPVLVQRCRKDIASIREEIDRLESGIGDREFAYRFLKTQRHEFFDYDRSKYTEEELRDIRTLQVIARKRYVADRYENLLKLMTEPEKPKRKPRAKKGASP